MADIPNPHALWEHNFIQQMKRLREARKMTQTDLARELKAFGLPFHQQTVQRVENGERPVRLNEAHLIAKVLGTDLLSMGASSTPSDHELRYSVDRLRATSELQADTLLDLYKDWREDIESLVFALADRVPATAKSVDSLDHGAAWGMVWAMKALRAYEDHLAAWQGLVGLGHHERAFVDLEDPAAGTDQNWPLPDVLATLQSWRERFGNDQMARAVSMNPREVYESFSSGRDQDMEG
ncbi:helix-turn-helix domain-containing protein [Nonomuraea sp. NPDC005650]|uniref:helix-turn-helix domain-containing protein n=1 Tax=Nonomuraea sp. NPDC005650 TaxID=3157045 RepID=UPI0033A52DB4